MKELIDDNSLLPLLEDYDGKRIHGSWIPLDCQNQRNSCFAVILYSATKFRASLLQKLTMTSDHKEKSKSVKTTFREILNFNPFGY